MSNKFWFTLHGWAGAQLGVLLFVVMFSGTLATLAYEIDWLLNPDLRVQPQDDKVGFGAMVAAVRDAYPERRLSLAYAPVGPRFAAELTTLPRDAAGFDFTRVRRVYVNPYNGAIQGETGWFNVQRTLRNFHMNLSLPSVGIYVVGSLGFVLLTSVVTALLFYKRWWRKFFILRLHRGRRVLWSDAHRAMGLWSMWFTLLMALTGIWYFIEMAMFDAGAGLQDIPAEPPRVAIERHRSAGGEPAPLPFDRLVSSVHDSYPGFEISMIYFPSAADEPVRFAGQGDAWLVRGRGNNVYVDPYDASVMAIYRAEELPLAYRWVHTADPLHFGDFAGLTVKLIWFVFGLAGAGLVLTGSYLWLRRNLQRSRDTGRRRRGAPAAPARSG